MSSSIYLVPQSEFHETMRIVYTLTSIFIARLVGGTEVPCPDQFDAVESCYGDAIAEMEDCLVCAHDWMTKTTELSTCEEMNSSALAGYADCTENGECDTSCDAQMQELNQCSMALLGCDLSSPTKHGKADKVRRVNSLQWHMP